MPWRDWTGPWWTGSRKKMTGNCNSGCDRFYGRGASCGRGFGRSFSQPSRLPSAENELSYLEAVSSDLESKLKNVRDRIEQLHTMPESKNER